MPGQVTRSTLHFEFQDLLGKVETTGNVFFVGSTIAGVRTASDSDGRSGRDPDNPFATIDFAVGQCTASNGDVIFAMPGHVETLAVASGVDMDVAGVSVIGLGQGASRPTITINGVVGADFKLAAAGCSIQNLLFVAGLNALTGPIEVSAAGCSIIDCEWVDSTGVDTIDVIVTTATGDNLLVDGFRYIFNGDATNQSVIQILTDCDGCEIRNCWIFSDSVLGGIEVQQAANVFIHDNHIENDNASDVCITLGTTSTGFISHNFLKIVTDAEVTWISATNDCALFENYGVNADAQTGALIGTVST